MKHCTEELSRRLRHVTVPVHTGLALNGLESWPKGQQLSSSVSACSSKKTQAPGQLTVGKTAEYRAFRDTPGEDSIGEGNEKAAKGSSWTRKDACFDHERDLLDCVDQRPACDQLEDLVGGRVKGGAVHLAEEQAKDGAEHRGVLPCHRLGQVEASRSVAAFGTGQGGQKRA